MGIFSSIKKMQQHADRITEYFLNAAIAYAILGEDDEMMAAITAGMVAAGKQRSTMISTLERMASELPFLLNTGRKMGDSKTPEFNEFSVASRLLFLKEQIEKKNWTLKDVVIAKGYLKQKNEKYARALDAANPRIFLQLRPQIRHLLID